MDDEVLVIIIEILVGMEIDENDLVVVNIIHHEAEQHHEADDEVVQVHLLISHEIELDE